MSPLLAYHGIQNRPGAAITSVSPASLTCQLDCLADRGFQFATLASAALDPGAGKVLAVTLDDATQEQLNAALPILQMRGIPGLALVVSDYVGRPARWDYAGRTRYHAGWPQLRDWLDAGMQVGSHSATHRDLRSLSDAALAAELAGSRALLEDRLNCEVRVLAYPFGRVDERVRLAAQKAGYRWGLGSAAGTDTSDPLHLPRVVVSRLDTCLSVEQRLSDSLWGSLERQKQRIIQFWAGGTPLYQRLRVVHAAKAP